MEKHAGAQRTQEERKYIAKVHFENTLCKLTFKNWRKKVRLSYLWILALKFEDLWRKLYERFGKLVVAAVWEMLEIPIQVIPTGNAPGHFNQSDSSSLKIF